VAVDFLTRAHALPQADGGGGVVGDAEQVQGLVDLVEVAVPDNAQSVTAAVSLSRSSG
jgi:hypothetical protein